MSQKPEIPEGNHEFSCPDGELDEVFINNASVHIERMDETAFWIGISCEGKPPLMLNTGVHRGTWYFNVEVDSLEDPKSFYVQRPRSSKLVACRKPEDAERIARLEAEARQRTYSDESVHAVVDALNARVKELEQERDELKRTVDIQAMAIYERNGDVDRARDEFNDYKERLWCALGQPKDIEFIAAVKELRKERDELKGAMRAQDERERIAATRLGMIHTCDWPDAVADELEAARAENAELLRQNAEVTLLRSNLAIANKEIEGRDVLNGQLQRENAALREQVARLSAAISWSLGEGDSDFRARNDGEGAYWWRTELRARAEGGHTKEDDKQ